MNVGTGTVTINGIGNYYGTVIKTFEILPGEITGLIVSGLTTQYDGNSYSVSTIIPDGVTVTYSEDGIIYNSSRPSYANAGTYKIYYKAEMTNYKSLSGYVSIVINPINISDMDITLDSYTYYYTGNQIKPEPLVFNDGVVLDKSSYDVTYINNVNVGKGTVYVTGIGNYSGIITVDFNIIKSNIENISIKGGTYTYNGTYRTIYVTVPSGCEVLYSKNGVDYSSSKPSYKNAGTYTIYYKIKKVNYNTIDGSVVLKINPINISNMTGTLAADLYTYTGYYIKPGVTLKTSTRTIYSGNYNVIYTNNKNPGIGTVTIKGKGNYTGTVTKTFKIKPNTTYVTTVSGNKYATIKWSNVAGDSGYQIYMSTSKTGTYTRVATVSASTYSFTKKGLSSGRTYYFKVRAYKRVGTTVIYGGFSSVKAVVIKPATPSVTVSSGKRYAYVKWSNVVGESGYQVYIATSKNGKYTKVATVNASTFSYKISGLKSGKTYYIKVRAFRRIGTSVLYGISSYPKAVTIK